MELFDRQFKAQLGLGEEEVNSIEAESDRFSFFSDPEADERVIFATCLQDQELSLKNKAVLKVELNEKAVILHEKITPI